MSFQTRRANQTLPPVRTRSRAAVVAFVLLGLVQLFVSVVVPFAEARAPSRLGAHIEQPSERRHYVHDDAYCSACIARHLTGTAPVAAPPAKVVARYVAQPPAALLLAPETERRSLLAARAPPAPSPLG
jgi:hypothetical protein